MLPGASVGPGLVEGRVSACSPLSAQSLGQGLAQRAQEICVNEWHSLSVGKQPCQHTTAPRRHSTVMWMCWVHQ